MRFGRCCNLGLLAPDQEPSEQLEHQLEPHEPDMPSPCIAAAFVAAGQLEIVEQSDFVNKSDSGFGYRLDFEDKPGLVCTPGFVQEHTPESEGKFEVGCTPDFGSVQTFEAVGKIVQSPGQFPEEPPRQLRSPLAFAR